MLRPAISPALPARLPGAAGLLVAGVVAAAALRWGLGGRDPASSWSAAVVFAAALLVLALTSGWRPAPPRLRDLAVGGFGGVVLVAVWLLSGAAALQPGLNSASLLPWSPLVVCVAVAEEAVLRGALFQALLRRGGTSAALAVTTLLFGLIHVPLYGVGALPLDLAVGLWLGGLRLLSGGWAAPALAHALADLAGGWLT